MGYQKGIKVITSKKIKCLSNSIVEEIVEEIGKALIKGINMTILSWFRYEDVFLGMGAIIFGAIVTYFIINKVMEEKNKYIYDDLE